MKKHAKNYLEHFGLTPADYIFCEVCSKIAVDLHHLKFKSHGGCDDVENIIALCRKCHSKAHSDRQFNESIKLIHSKNLEK